MYRYYWCTLATTMTNGLRNYICIPLARPQYDRPQSNSQFCPVYDATRITHRHCSDNSINIYNSVLFQIFRNSADMSNCNCTIELQFSCCCANLSRVLYLCLSGLFMQQHRNEFFVINVPIAVNVCLADQLQAFLCSERTANNLPLD